MQIHAHRLAALAIGLASSLAIAAVSSTNTRPQLSSTSAATYTQAKYLAQTGTLGSLTTDNWNPSSVATGTAKFKVAKDGTGTHGTVQAAINAAVLTGGSSRIYISVAPGTYTEVVCVPSSAPPITLFGTSSDAAHAVITYNNSNLTPKSSGTATSACAGNASATTVGTAGSATFTTLAKSFEARNLTIKNSYVEGSYSGSNQAAIALSVRGDKSAFQNIRVIGNQDTLYIGSGSYTTKIRAYFKASFIQGDMDFIFGHGTAVFTGCYIQYTASRLGSSGIGFIFAPSTRPANSYGFLVTSSTLNSSSSTISNQIYLGRAWDEGVGSLSAYVNGTSPNGQLVIRDSTITGHIRKTAPWGSSTASRPFCSSSCSYSTNRFFEYNNSGAGNGG